MKKVSHTQENQCRFMDEFLEVEILMQSDPIFALFPLNSDGPEKTEIRMKILLSYV